MSLETRPENGDERPKKERFERSNIGHHHQRNIVMEQANAEFSWNGLVIWARKQRLIHLDAGVGNQEATGQYGEAAGEAERESRGEIFHGGGKKMRIFTGSSDSIRHVLIGTSDIRKSGPIVMVCELGADKSTMYRLKKQPGGARKGAEKIGSLIACRKRQRYVMLCEAVLDSIGENGWRPDWPGDGLVKGACKQAWSKGRCANWPFGRSSTAKASRMGDFATNEADRRQNGMKI
jgi:hypothetical protein